MLWLLTGINARGNGQDFRSELIIPPNGRVFTTGSAVLKMSLSSPSNQDLYRGAGSAMRFNSAGLDVANRSGYMIFRDPQSPRYSGWGGKVYSDSIGRSWYQNDRGVPSSGSDPNLVLGSAILRGDGGGSINLIAAPQISGTQPGEFRYQALDRAIAHSTSILASAGNYVQDGRGTYTGSIVWNPPRTATGFTRYRADLIVSVRFGTDGIVTGGLNPIASPGGSNPPAYVSARQLDLDVLVAPTALDMDGRQSIRIRKTGVGPATPLETGWTNNQWLQSSTVHLKDDIKATSSTATIPWGNGNTILQGNRLINTWQASPTVYRLSGIELPANASTTIQIRAVTSNFSTASRHRVVGRVRFPALPTEAPNHPQLGNGVDFSVRLDKFEVVTPPNPG